MKTDFLVLWVDDNTLVIDSLKPTLEKWLEEKGFELKILPHKDETNVLRDVKNTDIELIIVDYKMPKKSGDVLIDEIRASGCYQDVIFYSEAQIPKTKILDGVFYVLKVDAITRIKELIELKLKRSIDPVSVRGWIVADAIELESMITELLERCFIAKDGYTFTKRFFYDHDAPIDFGRKVNTLQGILNDLIIYSLTIKDAAEVEKLKTCNTIYKSFVDDVVLVRNAVAHSKIEETEQGKAIKMKTKSAKPLILDEPTVIQIRNGLRKHYNNLLELQKMI